MMQAGEWRATNEAAHPSRRGYHLNSLYSPFVSFGQFARKFVESSRALLAQMELQNFRNSWEALPYAKYQVKVKDQAVEALKTSVYRRGEIPPVEPLYLVAGYDPGELKTHWVVCAVSAGGELWVIDWGTILGIRTIGDRKGVAAHFAGLHYQSGDFHPALGLIDSGWETESIYTECTPIARPTLPHQRIFRRLWSLEPDGIENASGPGTVHVPGPRGENRTLRGTHCPRARPRAAPAIKRGSGSDPGIERANPGREARKSKPVETDSRGPLRGLRETLHVLLVGLEIFIPGGSRRG